MKTNKWLIYKEWKRNATPYLIEVPKDINSKEIFMCIAEQIYGQQEGEQ